MMTAEKQRYSNTANLVLCGLFAALTAICSFISIPLGFTPIPMNLGTLAVFLTGGILGKKYGTISLVVYVLLGAAGIPVFAGFRAGISVLVGPTGGYIVGYIVAAFVIGAILDRFFDGRKRRVGTGNSEQVSGEYSKGSFGQRPEKTASSVFSEMILCILSMTAGTALCYGLGTLWFMFSTSTELWASLVACVFPFLLGDAIKIFAASLLVRKLRPVLH